ncbi:MAG: hypothetical protein WBO74_06995, partial [Thermoanaerobaculia bacterium]
MRTAISFSLLLSLFATVASFASNATGLGSPSGADGRYTSSTCLSSTSPIFADGFESGDSSNWTAQVPCRSDGGACLEQVGSIDFPSETGRVVISGAYAYTTGYDFLRVVDISDPTYPIESGSLEGMYGNFEVAGKYLYATHHDPADWGFRVVDISNSASPVEIGSLFFGEFPMGIALSGNHVFVPTHLKGLRVIDVANPTHPVQV